MSRQTENPLVARRSFLARLGAGVTVAGAFASGAPQASAQAPASGFRPTRHPQDDWLDALPGGHRFVFDTTTMTGIENALLYANNFYIASQTGYSLGNADTAVVIVVRHLSTPFGYNDTMWKKYAALSKMTGAVDPQTKQPATTNIHMTGGDESIANLAKRGTQFAVCQMATRFFAGQLAQGSGSTADAVYADLTSNLVPNAHMVAAGILAVNRAQERGYTLATTI